MRKKEIAKSGPSLYEVQEGDTLCSIAACLNTSPKKIMELNTDIITNPNYIYPVRSWLAATQKQSLRHRRPPRVALLTVIQAR